MTEDHLALIKTRWEERGRPGGDFAWLLAEVERLRHAILRHLKGGKSRGIRYACFDRRLLDAAHGEHRVIYGKGP